MSDAREGYLGQVMSLFKRRKLAEAVATRAPMAAKQPPQPESPAKCNPSRQRTAAAPAPESRPPRPKTPPVPARKGPAEKSEADRRDLQAFEQKLRQLGSQADSMSGLVAGRVHMLNTEKVRERLGDKWPRFEDRIHDIIKAELKKRLGEHDLFTKANDSTYVIVFGDCSEIEARVKVALLSEQILEKILGEAEAKDLEALGVQRMVVEADGKVAAEAVQGADALMDLLDQAQTNEPQPAPYYCDDAAAGRRALTAEEVSHLLGGADDQVTEAEQDQSGSDAPVIKVDRLRQLIRGLEGLEEAMPTVRYPAGDLSKEARDKPAANRADVKPALDRIQQIKERAERQIVFLYDRDPHESETGSTPSSEPQVDFTYLPMWHAPSQKIGVYLCRAAVQGPDGAPIPEQAGSGDTDLLAVVDRLTLRKVQSDIAAALAQGEPNLIAVPVHFSTLQAQRNRNRLFDLCRRMPEDHRSLLMWEIIGAHFEAWSLQLPEILRQMRLFGRAVFLRLEGMEDHFVEIRRNLPYLRTTGIHAVGLDVAKLRGPESRRLHLLERLAKRAEDNGLRCYGHGFESLSMTVCAVCMGYQHVSGPAIADPVARPDGIHGTAMEAIYKRVILGEAAAEADA